MRWDRLFADLEARMHSEQRWELEAEVADRTRAERAGVDLLSRLVGARAAGGPVVVRTMDGTVHEGLVADVGSGWLLLHAPGQVLVPTDACCSFTGLPRSVGVPGQIERRLGLGSVLRALSRDRAVVDVTDRSGHRSTGTIDGVGADLLEVAEHPMDVERRRGHVTARRVVPFAALAFVAQRIVRR